MLILRSIFFKHFNALFYNFTLMGRLNKNNCVLFNSIIGAASAFASLITIHNAEHADEKQLRGYSERLCTFCYSQRAIFHLNARQSTIPLTPFCDLLSYPDCMVRRREEGTKMTRGVIYVSILCTSRHTCLYLPRKRSTPARSKCKKQRSVHNMWTCQSTQCRDLSL